MWSCEYLLKTIITGGSAKPSTWAVVWQVRQGPGTDSLLGYVGSSSLRWEHSCIASVLEISSIWTQLATHPLLILLPPPGGQRDGGQPVVDAAGGHHLAPLLLL